MIDNEKIEYKKETLGSYINAYNVKKMNSLIIKNAKKIIFIENKANYIDYIQNRKAKDEFVVYHGGMYSPVKGEFFSEIYKVASDLDFYHWSDIDLGGFKIFTRLNIIIPQLRPYLMDKEAFYSKKDYWKEMKKDYIEKLLELKKDEKYKVFNELIDEMVKNKAKLEQEAFI